MMLSPITLLQFLGLSVVMHRDWLLDVLLHIPALLL
jgi:hypothetical protein